MISNRCQYALLAMLELARREGEGLVTIAQIARARHIPVRFLESILLTLKQNGYTKSIRGKAGGYLLARPAARISAGEIVRLFEGPLFLPAAPRRSRVEEYRADIFHPLWTAAEIALARVFDAVSFAQLARQDELNEHRASLHYEI